MLNFLILHMMENYLVKQIDEESDTLAKLFIEFDIIECSTYTASNTSLVKNPDTGDNIMLYIALGMITLIGTTVLITRKRFN